MIKKLIIKTLNFAKIIKELQKYEAKKISSESTKEINTKLLWDYCSALRGPDMELENSICENGFKALFTEPLRGFNVKHALSLSISIEAQITFIDNTYKHFSNEAFADMKKNNKAYEHYLFHIYGAWKAIIVIVQNKEQRKLIKKLNHEIEDIRDYFYHSMQFIDSMNKVKSRDAMKSLKKYVNILIELLKTMQ